MSKATVIPTKAIVKTKIAKSERIKIKVDEKRRSQIELIKTHLAKNEELAGVDFSDELAILVSLGFFVSIKKLA